MLASRKHDSLSRWLLAVPQKRKEKQPFSRRFTSVFQKLKEKRVLQRAARTPRGTGLSDRLWLIAGSAAAVERKLEKPGINHGGSIKQERTALSAQGGPSLGAWLLEVMILLGFLLY